MPKRKKKSVDKTRFSLITVIVLLVALCATLTVLLYGANTNLTTTAINVNLGPLEYLVINDRPLLRSDPAVNSLRTFLAASAQKDVQLGCTSSFYRVIAATTDEHQVLLNYGCSYPNANMFAVYTSGNWRMISPINEFNEFGIPVCSYADQNNISSEVAPVCVNQIFQTSATLYKVR